MSPLTIIEFLIGRERAIRHVATTRSSIALGALFVMTAALAREYDRRDLLAEPLHLLLPVVASLAISAVQFTLFWLPRSRFESTSTAANAYRSFLACFWMTAPIAWLYAIPYERFMDEGAAFSANVNTLLFVSLWRGVLICRVLTVLTGVHFIHALIVSSLLAVITMLVALAVMPVPIFNVMGGLAQSPAVDKMAELAFLARLFGFGSLLLLVPLGLLVMFKGTARWNAIDLDIVPSYHVSVGAWSIGAASFIGLLATLPYTQPPCRRAHRVDTLLADGKIDDGLALLASDPIEAFPHGWHPLPIMGMPIRQPPLLDVAERAARLPADSWVRRYYLNESVRVHLPSRWWIEDPNEWCRFLALIDSVPEGAAIRREHADQIKRFEDESAANASTTRPSKTPPTTRSAP